ncbi:MAG TPA: hypothetical protein VGW75_06825 [Solirubrobacteraceae bacterium]|jgi:hypothetical protein|nr:hypothetical protein [Solirubrobacteraceae bacterium]
MKAPERHLEAVAYEPDARQGPEPLIDERRLMKAALLYADRIEMFTVTRLVKRNYPPYFHHLPGASAQILATIGDRLAGRPDQWQHASNRDLKVIELGLAELRIAADAGVLILPSREDVESQDVVWNPDRVPVVSQWTADVWARRRYDSANPADRDLEPLWEGALASTLLSELEGFPDASIDELLDVRERLAGPRIRFRAAMASAARELAGADERPNEVAAVVQDLRVRVIEPSLLEIREALTALDARSTLLRLAGDTKVTTAAASATLSMTVAAGGAAAWVAALLQAAAGAPIASALAQEVSFRDSVRARVRARPYWMLHEIARTLRRG